MENDSMSRLSFNAKFWKWLSGAAYIAAIVFLSSPAVAATVEVVHYICKPERHTLYVGTSVVSEAMVGSTADIIPIDDSLTEDRKTQSCNLSPTDKVVVKIYSDPSNERNDNVYISINGKYLNDLPFDEHEYSYTLEKQNNAKIQISYSIGSFSGKIWDWSGEVE
jgi:hypothetical protein